MRIALDAGHGGTAPGTSGHDIIEKTWAMEFAARLGHYLRSLGAQTTFTRMSDVNPALTARARTAVKAGCDVFLSIHCNGATSASAEGVEAFYAPCGDYQGNSVGIAQSLVNVCSMAGMRNRGVKRDSQSQHAKLTVLRESCKSMPAVLLEVGFVSSPHDSKLMKDPKWVERLAAALARVIVE